MKTFKILGFSNAFKALPSLSLSGIGTYTRASEPRNLYNLAMIMSNVSHWDQTQYLQAAKQVPYHLATKTTTRKEHTSDLCNKAFQTITKGIRNIQWQILINMQIIVSLI